MSGMTSFSTDHRDDFLEQTIFLTHELLVDLLYHINSLNSFVPEKEHAWTRQLINLTSDLESFVEITTLLSKVLMIQKKQSLPQIKESHTHLLFIVKAINQARMKEDFVALEELIKYELKDNLTVWKIDLISQTKRLLKT